jgi:hypothetical protein
VPDRWLTGLQQRYPPYPDRLPTSWSEAWASKPPWVRPRCCYLQCERGSHVWQNQIYPATLQQRYGSGQVRYWQPAYFRSTPISEHFWGAVGMSQRCRLFQKVRCIGLGRWALVKSHGFDPLGLTRFTQLQRQAMHRASQAVARSRSRFDGRDEVAYPKAVKISKRRSLRPSDSLGPGTPARTRRISRVATALIAQPGRLAPCGAH